MASTGLQETFVVPKHLLAGKSKFGMDIGGSLIKVAQCVEEGDDVRVTFTSYVKENMREALQEIRDSVRFEEGELITTTGIGSHQFKDLIQDTLGVRATNILELDCFVDALKFLIENRPLEDFVYPPSEKGKEMYEETMKMVRAMMANMANIKTNIDTDDWELPDENTAKASAATKYSLDDVFPCLLVMIGSGAGYMKVEKDGKTAMIEGSTTAGRMILGLGSLLTGTKTFDELVSLAEAGDASKVEVTCKDLKRPSSDGEHDPNDMYSLMGDHVPVYAFGHGVGKDLSDFKKEDLAAEIISNVAQSIASTGYMGAVMADAKMVLFCGSVCGHSNYIRDEISKFFEVKSKLNLQKIERPYHFLKYGGYLGALGTIIRGGTL